MSGPKPVHMTSAIPLEDFQAGYLKPHSHSREEISDVIIKHVSRRAEDITTRQREGLARFKYQGTWSLAKPENLQDLKKFFDIFNDVYFNGVLTGYCQLEALEENTVTSRLGFYCLGYCQTKCAGYVSDPRFKTEKPSSSIIISNRRWGQATSRIEQCLEILIHEMLHAIFDIFTCYCDYGCLDRFSRKYYTSGHDVYWQATAYAIEKADAVGGNLLGLNLTWNREVDIALDIDHGYTLPNDAVLRSLGLDIREIWRNMKNFRIDRNRERKKREIVHLPSNRCIKNDWILEF
jgi:hypothetical protein